jgi:hypothetical protein
MSLCYWAIIVVRIEFLEWTPENRWGHPRFAGIPNENRCSRGFTRDDYFDTSDLKKIRPRVPKGAAGQHRRQFIDRGTQDHQAAVMGRNLGVIIRRYRTP